MLKVIIFNIRNKSIKDNYLLIKFENKNLVMFSLQIDSSKQRMQK